MPYPTNHLHAHHYEDQVKWVLRKIERSFGFERGEISLRRPRTFQQLVQLVSRSAEGTPANDCTTQQAFYKLRNAIVVTQNRDKSTIRPDSGLHFLFPESDRRKRMAAVENHLGFKTDTLHAKKAPGCAAGLFFVASFVLIFFKWRWGLPLFLFSIAILKLVKKRGNELGRITMGEWAKRIARENYRQARRHPGTINKNEIEGVIKAIFCHELGLPESAFTAETKLP